MSHAQGGCYRCRRGSDLVDMDCYVEGEGALALCKGCIQDAAEAADLHLNAAAVADIQIQHAEERRQFGPDRVAELEAALAEAEEALLVKSKVEDRLDKVMAASASRVRKAS